MTMIKKLNAVAACEFKARCRELLDLVAETGEELVVTKRRKAVARLVPVEAPLRNSVVWEKDLVSPVSDQWDVET
jgi:prevent-host-death family protein